jgi:dolichyl-phosphate beta-glucosyltransferase
MNNPAGSILFSLIVLAYNEELRIGKSLEQILPFCNALGAPYEIIVVDDGSSDGTVSLVRGRFGDQTQLQLIQQPTRGGKGGAVRAGMLQARGDYLFFSDADLSVPIATLPAFFEALRDHCDIAIGSRRAPGAKIEVHQPWLREMLARVFTSLSTNLLGLRYYDLTCGFKGFRRDAAQELFTRQRLCNWSFDCEILFIARLKNYRVTEIPVSWRNAQGTKVRLWKDAAGSFFGLIEIRWNQWLGRYR